MKNKFMSLSLGVSLCLVSFGALAAEPVNVLFFGGYRASYDQMRCWEHGARAQVNGADVNFRAFSYPAGASSSAPGAIQGAQEKITRLVAEIKANPKRRYLIVGHSSGAAISNRIAELAADASRIELVTLDGFTPSKTMQNRMTTSCYWAINPQTGLKSRNASSMQANCKVPVRWEQPTCRTSWCLHFALVNTLVPRNLGTDFPVHGYDGCAANIEYVKRSKFLK